MSKKLRSSRYKF